MTHAGLSDAFREAAPLPIQPGLVEECIQPGDCFAQAWRKGLDLIPPAERRGRLCVETGLIAESVATLLLEEAGLDVFAELAAAGVHGVDLLALTPAGQVLALEVKGTLRSSARPRLGRGRLRQMSLEWLSSPDNPAMLEWEFEGVDVYGGLAQVNFATMDWRVMLTQDHQSWASVHEESELLDLSFLEAAAR